MLHVQILGSNTAQFARVCQVCNVVVDFYDIFEVGAGHPKAALQVLKRVLRLSLKIRGHTAIVRSAAPARYKNHFSRRRSHNVRVTRRLFAIQIQKLFRRLAERYRGHACDHATGE